ncbi:MAG: hypothetical protein ACK4Z5_05425, partial [Brevundimonas sp.]
MLGLPRPDERGAFAADDVGRRRVRPAQASPLQAQPEEEVMKDVRFDAVLDASAPDFAERLMEAIGAKPGEPVEIMTPQFDRTDGIRPVVANLEFANLPGYSEQTIRALGCLPWDEPDENG